MGKDVAEVLGYATPQKAVRDHVDNEDRTVNESFTVNGTPLTLINESGLYSLVLPVRPSPARFSCPLCLGLTASTSLVAVPCFCCAGRGPLAKSRPLPLLRFGCFCRRQRLSCAVPRAGETR